MADRILTRADRDPLDNHAILVRGNTIAAVGPGDRIVRTHARDRVIRFKNRVLLPGLVNTHTHLELSSLTNSFRSTNYISWVLKLLKAKAGLTTQYYQTAARRNIRDIIRSGTTTVAEISTHNTSPALLKRSGLRALVYEEIVSMRPGSAITLNHLHRNTALLRYGLSPHSPHTVSEETLIMLRRYAKKNELPLCMHVAEIKDEHLLLQQKKSGLEKLYAAAGWDLAWAPRASSSFQYLARLKMLGRRFLAVHAVQADAEDVNILVHSGASVAHCPRSNRALHAGTMNLRAMLDAGVPVGLGTDSLASVRTLNLWDEMRFALRTHEHAGVSAKDILHLATLGGAQALGLEKEIGSLETGKKADIIAVPVPRHTTTDICSDLISDTGTSLMTMVNGRFLYRTVA